MRTFVAGDPAGDAAPGVDMVKDPTTMVEALDAFLADQFDGQRPTVEGLRSLSVGRSRQNWSFDLTWPGGDGTREALILRRDPAGGLVETDRSQEFAVLKALADTPVPAPVARWLDPDGRWFGQPALIMRRERGTCEYRVLSGDRPLDQRLGLARDLCDLLVDVHAVPWADADSSVFRDPGEAAAAVELDQWEGVLRRDQLEPWPELELALGKLRAEAPRATERVLVHGDFKPGNVLLDGVRIESLLDWELAHVGDPMEDLGWVTQPLRRREHIIPGSWEEEQIFAHYEDASGRRVDVGAVRWWAMFATFRTAIMQVSGLRSFVEGRSDEPYRPTAKVLGRLLDDLDIRKG